MARRDGAVIAPLAAGLVAARRGPGRRRGHLGPDLDERLPAHTAASLRRQILDPAAGAPGGFTVMPSDFGERMSRAELDALVAFLLETAR